MNHLAENVSLISRLRIIFTLARAPFPPLSLVCRSSQSSARSRSNLGYHHNKEMVHDRTAAHLQSSDCEIDSNQCFGLTNTPRATLMCVLVCLGVNRSRYRSITPDDGTRIRWTAK